MMEAKTNEQYRAFQHEIDFCQQEIRRHEDRILDLMGESEPLEKNVKAAEAALAAEKKAGGSGESVRARADGGGSEGDGCAAGGAGGDPRRDDAGGRCRNTSASGKGRAGVAIAEVLQGRCSKCNITIRPQFMQELKRGDSVMVCESCKRMLYWNPPHER